MKTAKHLFGIGLLPLLLAACSGDDLYVSLTSSSLYETVIVEKSRNHLAFPTIVGKDDFSRITIAYREGSTHDSFDGQLVQMHSYDRGQTWEGRQVIYQAPEGADARDPQFLKLDDHTILCRFFERNHQASTNKTVAELKCLVSTDGGDSYIYLSTLPNRSSGQLAAARGNMVLVDGTIYSTAYNEWSESWLLRSADQGRSWEQILGLDASIKSAYTDTHINETALAFSNGKLCLAGRQSESGDGKMLWGESSDWGKTWNWTKMADFGQGVSLTEYSGKLFLTYRKAEVKGYTFNFSQVKEAEITDKLQLLYSSNVDIGYGDVLFLGEKEYLVCFYTPETIYCTRFQLK